MITLNTIKTDTNISIRIVDDNLTTLLLYCYDNNTMSRDYIDINIMDNSYLPNLYNYTSLNPNVSTVMDYMVQKPFIIQMKNNNNIPIYCLANIPKYPNNNVKM